MHRYLKLTPFLALLLLTTLPFVIRAQEDDTFGLSEDDYELLADAIDNTDDADSFQLTYSATLFINDPETGEQSAELAGGGMFIHDDDSPALLLTSSGTSSNVGDLPTSFNREVRLVDGVGYNNLVDLTTGDSVGWQSETLAEPFIVYNLARILIDPSALNSLDLLDIVNLTDAVAALDLRPYVTVRRNADVTDKGQTLAYFTATLDTNSLFESPEFARKLIDILIAAGEDPGIPTDQMAAAGILIGRMFRGSSLTVDLYVDDEYLTRASADFTLSLDASLLTGEGQPINANVTLDFSLSGFDEEFEVTAPSGSVLVDSQTLPLPVTVTDGDTIASGSPVIVDLTGSVDLLYNAANPETVTITARSLDGTVDTVLDLYDGSGRLLGSNDDTSIALPNFSQTDSAISNVLLPAEGVYTIRLDSFSGVANGQVEVLVNASAAQVEVPRLDGKVLFDFEPLKVYLTGQDSVNLLYRIVGRETISLYVSSLETNASAVDSTLEVLDADGNRIAFNDDFREGSTDSGLENLSLSAGIYTIRVNSYDSTEIGGVLVELVTGLDGDNGDEPSFDGPIIGLGDTLTGTITDSSTDEYHFAGTAGQVITISAEATDPVSGEQDLYLTLYDSNGNEVASDDDSGEAIGLGFFDPAIISFTLPASDTYLIVVDSIFDVSGAYEITLVED